MPNDVPRHITENDREASVRRLQEAFAEGHISHADMNDHLQAVLTAKTPGDLVPVLASLRDGEIVDVENISKYLTPKLAYVVRAKAKVGGQEGLTPISLRVTDHAPRRRRLEDRASARRPNHNG